MYLSHVNTAVQGRFDGDVLTKDLGSPFLVLAAPTPGFSLLLQGLLKFQPSHLNSSQVGGKEKEDMPSF